MPVGGEDPRYGGAREDRDAALEQCVPHVAHDVDTALGAHVADGDRDEAESRRGSAFLQALDRIVSRAVHAFRRAVVDIDVVHLPDQEVGLSLALNVGEVPTHGVGQGELAVRERAGASPAGEDGARLAVAAPASRGARGAVPAVDVGSLVQNGDAQPRLFAQFHRGKDACRAGADDDDVKIALFHVVTLYWWAYVPISCASARMWPSIAWSSCCSVAPGRTSSTASSA